MQIEEDVKRKVESLLQGLLWDPKNPKVYDVVLNKLTRMAILGTAPASCRTKK